MAISDQIPAAQYLRVSTEHQRYSLDNQHDLIARYAVEHGLSIVRTFTDQAKSGLLLRNRLGLQQLLREVLKPQPGFQVVLVYDVSRWGRFQDIDEAGHYEFVCKHSGIPVHYCAETFVNDGSALSFLMKAIKRGMAAEYSRELGVKVLAGQKRVAALGFRVGGYAGYGLRRMLVTADRRAKELLKIGDRKSIATDRVVLVPGTAQEVACVREIYQMVIEQRMSFVAIANELNRRGVAGPGSTGWSHYQVREIVTNPKYNGTVVYGRVSKRLRTPEVKVSPDRWIVAPNAFEPVIAPSTYHAAQGVLANRTINKSNEQVLEELRSILKTNGKLTSRLIRSSTGATPAGTYRGRFGSLGRAYAMIGYEMSNRRNIETRRRMQHIRLALLHELESLFPENIAIVSRKGHYRKHLLINGEPISVLACNCFRSQWGHIRWRIRVPEAENRRPLLLMLMNNANDDCQKIYLLPAITLPPAIDIASDSRILLMGQCLSSNEAFLELFSRFKGKLFDRAFSGAFLRAHA
jgi:DNA invertase Pin-like site-specific DNA recombinase